MRHSSADGLHNEIPFTPHMWPVQTLTLLLCLTDEEQLFAQQIPVLEEPARIEVAVPAPEEDALLLVIEDQA